MKVFLNIFGHTNNASLPLRMGIVITEKHQQFAELVDASYDEKGTNGQRPSEIESGNRHYTGILEIPNADKNLNAPHRLECRIVLGEPKNSEQSPPIITILMKNSNAGDMTVTKHIEGMLKRGKITVQDLISVFHPAYVRGEIKSSNDCEDLYREKIESIKLDTINV